MFESPAPAEAAAAHVSGIVVYVAADRAEPVSAAIDSLSGAEVAAREAGKLVVVLEAPDEAGLNELFCQIQLLDDVLSAALVSHYRDA